MNASAGAGWAGGASITTATQDALAVIDALRTELGDASTIINSIIAAWVEGPVRRSAAEVAAHMDIQPNV